MKNEIKLKQVCAIFLTIFPITKMITAPSVLAHYCNEKLWQPALILFALDILLILMLFYTSKRCGNKNFYEILSSTYGEVFAKIILFLYAIYFILKAFIPIIEHKELIDNSLYETLPRSTIFYPAFIVIFYMCYKGLKNYARGIELCFFLSITGLILVFFLSFNWGNFNYLRPFFKGTTLKSPLCALKSLFWFNDGIYFLCFMGNFKVKKHSFLKLATCYSISAIFVILFLMVFYSIFTYIAPTQKNALSQVGIFSVSLVNVGRFDYIATFLLTLSGIFAIALPILCSTEFLKIVFNLKTSLLPALINCLILFGLTLAFSTKYYQILNFFTAYLTPVFVIFGYLLPLLTLGGKKSCCLNAQK